MMEQKKTTSDNEASLMKAFELCKSMISMLHGDDKVPLKQSTALDTLALIPMLQKYLPKDTGISFFVERIIPACETIREITDEYLDNNTKDVLVNAFKQLETSIANYLYGMFEEYGVEVTPANISLLRNIVAINMIGEEID